MIKLMDLLREFNAGQLDYIARQLGIERTKEYEALMNALDSQGTKYPVLKDKIAKGEIKTFDDLKKLRKVSKSSEERAAAEGAEKIFEDDNYLVIVPLTHQASCKYGKGTKWCTTERNSAYWLSYVIDDKITLYYILDKELKPSDPLYKIAVLVDKNNNIKYIYDAKDDSIEFDDEEDIWAINYLKSKGVKFISKTDEILKNTEKETDDM